MLLFCWWFCSYFYNFYFFTIFHLIALMEQILTVSGFVLQLNWNVIIIVWLYWYGYHTVFYIECCVWKCVCACESWCKKKNLTPQRNDNASELLLLLIADLTFWHCPSTFFFFNWHTRANCGAMYFAMLKWHDPCCLTKKKVLKGILMLTGCCLCRYSSGICKCKEWKSVIGHRYYYALRVNKRKKMLCSN